MSNNTLINRIEEALAKYENGDIDRKALISSVEENGSALEMMPYRLIKEIEEIEYQLTVAQFADEDEFLPCEEEALARLSSWLNEVPRETQG